MIVLFDKFGPSRRLVVFELAEAIRADINNGQFCTPATSTTIDQSVTQHQGCPRKKDPLREFQKSSFIFFCYV